MKLYNNRLIEEGIYRRINHITPGVLLNGLITKSAPCPGGKLNGIYRITIHQYLHVEWGGFQIIGNSYLITDALNCCNCFFTYSGRCKRGNEFQHILLHVYYTYPFLLHVDRC